MRLLRHLVLAIFSFAILSLAFVTTIKAETKPAFVTIVMPVRGEEFWQTTERTPLTAVQEQYEDIKKYNLPATWLLRYDALQDQRIVDFFKQLPSNQELGLFFEITPGICNAAGVKYNQSESWHFAQSVFLTGYSQEDRRKLIDTYFAKFKELFGYHPKSVGAWWIDAYSLGYMREKYGILANLDVADQFSTDNYQIWGQYFGVPFYPAKRNALIPAQSAQEKIGTVTLQWAARDPLNGYGGGVRESTYSVQANDYVQSHQLDSSYFEKLFEIYTRPKFASFGQLTIGLENSFGTYGDELLKQIEVVNRHKSEVLPINMADFANWYTKTFPNISPQHLIYSQDPLGSESKVVWFMNQYYRVGWFYDGQKIAIRDLRTYNDSVYEHCYATVCNQLNFAITASKALDDATFGDKWVIDEGTISNLQLSISDSKTKISYLNQGGKDRSLIFATQDLFLDGEGVTIPGAILKVLSGGQEQNQVKLSFEPRTDYSSDWLRFAASIPIFLIFVVVAFYIPGRIGLDLSGLNFGKLGNLAVSFVYGLVIFTLASFLLGYLKVQFLLAVLLGLSVIYYLFRHRPKLLLPTVRKEHLFLAVIIFIGSLLQGMVVFKSGWSYPFGLGFWGPNGHDAVFHLSVINQLTNGLPPESPFFAGFNLKNYHYFADLLLAQTHNVTKINIQDLYFRLYPVFISVLLGTSVFLLTRKISQNYLAANLAVILVYTAGSFGWIIAIIKGQSIFSGESAFWANQAISAHLNLPFAVSLPLFIVGIFLLANLDLSAKWISLAPLILIFGSLIEFKVYAGIIVLGTLGLVFAKEVLITRQFRLAKVFLPIFFLSLLIYLPTNLASQSLIVFSPFWFVHAMIDAPDRVGWARLSIARQVYLTTGNWPKFFVAEILGFLVFLIGNLGVRILFFVALIPFFKTTFKLDNVRFFLVLAAAIGIFLPLVFIQKGNPWNAIQFLYYSQVIAAIFAAVVWTRMVGVIKNRTFKFLTTFVLLVFAFPTTIGTLRQYIPARPPARLSFAELEALNFLKSQSDNIVLTYPYNKDAKQQFLEPVPLFAYETTAYVSAFSGKTTYLEDELNLTISDYPIDDRLPLQKFFFKTRDTNWMKRFLEDNEIKYIYLTKFQHFDPDTEKLGLKKIFENEETKVYRVL